MKSIYSEIYSIEITMLEFDEFSIVEAFRNSTIKEKEGTMSTLANH